MKTKREAYRPPKLPMSVETFAHPVYRIEEFLRANEPSCFNGIVSVRKYKITAELIGEPKAVIAERLQALWDHSQNHHEWMSLKAEADRIGYELVGSPGNKA